MNGRPIESPPAAAGPTASISDVARETGLSKDTLRAWERRYGFPSPARDANDERVYTLEQIKQLRVIRRLLDSGLRPGKIVGLTLDELSSFSDFPVAKCGGSGESDRPRQLLDLLRAHRAEQLRQSLGQLLMELGLKQFILEVIVPLNSLVGDAWLAGSIEIFEEHLYTQQVQAMLQHALGTLSPAAQRPRVLLTTLPEEEHQLGLLMAHVFLAMEGAQCVFLGTQTPSSDIIKAVAAHDVDIVGLSCTTAKSPRGLAAQLTSLRDSLDRRIGLWVGGAMLCGIQRVAGIRWVAALTELHDAVAEWRAHARAQHPHPEDAK